MELQDGILHVESFLAMSLMSMQLWTLIDLANAMAIPFFLRTF